MEVDNNTDMNASVFDLSQDQYNELFDNFHSKITFKGYTIEEWGVALKLTELRDDFSLDELERYTIKISTMTDIITTNYSEASATYHGMKRSAERCLMIAKQSVISEIDAHNESVANPASKRRYPSADLLETQAYNKCSDSYNKLAMCEVFYYFWKAQYDRVFLLNQRVTSLNVLKNIESKGIQLT